MIFFLRNKTNTFARLNSNKNIGHDRIQLKKFDQMMQSINIRCMQHFLYFESHTKSLHIIVCFSVLSISSAFTISTYFINECMYLDEISRKQ